MIVTEARLAANRRNAAKSTGPKTPEGKARSRANALKHGLCASVCVPEDVELVQQRAYQWYYTLKPQTEYHAWLVDQITVISLRIDRGERIERRTRDRSALRAELGWDDDRRLDAEKLGAQLTRRPSEVAEALRRTPHGCEWLMARWAMLAHSADVHGEWTAEQTRLAFDLLGTPAEFRAGRPGASLDFDGREVESADDPAAVARREIAALKDRREAVADLDEVDRALVEADLTDEADPELRKLRRYESALHGRLRWCLAQLQYVSPHIRPHPDLTPSWARPVETEPEAEIKPEPKAETPAEPVKARRLEKWEMPDPHPPFNLEPHEGPLPGEKLDVVAVVAAREVKRLEKVEARREARRRKAEKLRAG